MEFKPVEAADKSIITAYTIPAEISICDYSFGNLYDWSFLYQTSWAIIDEHLVIRFRTPDRDHPLYLFPVAPGPYHIESVVERLNEEAQRGGYPFTMMSICPRCHAALEDAFPGRFYFFNDRNWSDYIYLRTSLASLSGKKLQSKRNHVNRFVSAYPDYRYEEITDANAEECLRLADTWREEKEDAESLASEMTMVQRAMSQRSQIGLVGGAIRAEGRIVAFSMGTAINYETFGISIEKADPTVPGAFNIINRDFARHIPEQYVYVNREEDLGIEGLRQAKLSYKPYIILPKETAILRND